MLPLLLLLSADLTAEKIMERVVANQERSVAARKAVVYKQYVLAQMRRGNDKISREEESEFQVTATPKSYKKDRTSFKGRYEKDGKYIDYDQPHHEYKDVDIDGDVISDLTDDLTNDKDAKDGVSSNLFPLTADKIDEYKFALKGEEIWEGHPVYRIAYKDPSGYFAGEALIDRDEFQPRLIETKQTKGLPIAVRTILGTSLKKTAFRLAYTRVDKDLWFPSSYRSEFDVRVLFGYRRKVSIEMKNSGIQRVQIDSSIKYEDPTEK